MIIIQPEARAVLLMHSMSKYHDALRAFATCGRARALTWRRTQKERGRSPFLQILFQIGLVLSLSLDHH
jgi:hypothetical protein